MSIAIGREVGKDSGVALTSIVGCVGNLEPAISVCVGNIVVIDRVWEITGVREAVGIGVDVGCETGSVLCGVGVMLSEVLEGIEIFAADIRRIASTPIAGVIARHSAPAQTIESAMVPKISIRFFCC